MPSWIQRVRARANRKAEAIGNAQALRFRRIYILPTRNGVLLALVLMAMLFGAINYGNSLAYALMFLLTSVAVISILHTYRNIAGLTIHTEQCRPTFAGGAAIFPIRLVNPGKTRFALALESPGAEPVITDLAQYASHWVELRIPAPRRGWLERGRLTISTRFPLGLFRAWCDIHLPQRCLVYPAPEREGPLPIANAGGGEGRSAAQGGGELSALRAYRPGDSLKHVHWKALAREQGLLTRIFGSSGSRDFCLHWDDMAGLGTEARISRLCRWVLWVDAQGQRYEVILPGVNIPAAQGESQKRRCLEALALFGAAP